MKFCLVVPFFIFFNSSLSFAQHLQITEVGFKLSDEDRQRITLLSEYEAKVYNELFNTNSNDTLQIHVSIFKKRGDYLKACNSKGLDLPPTLGLYSSLADQCFIYKHDKYINTVIHEMGHAFMHHNLKFAPRWLSEGISEFFESITVENGRISVSQQSWRLSKITERSAEPFNFKYFINQNQTDWGDHDKFNDMYNRAYSIVYFIMKTKPDNLKRLTLGLKNRGNSEQAINAIYGSVGNFERQYADFYRKYWE